MVKDKLLHECSLVVVLICSIDRVSPVRDGSIIEEHLSDLLNLIHLVWVPINVLWSKLKLLVWVRWVHWPQRWRSFPNLVLQDQKVWSNLSKVNHKSLWILRLWFLCWLRDNKVFHCSNFEICFNNLVFSVFKSSWLVTSRVKILVLRPWVHLSLRIASRMISWRHWLHAKSFYVNIIEIFSGDHTAVLSELSDYPQIYKVYNLIHSNLFGI